MGQELLFGLGEAVETPSRSPAASPGGRGEFGQCLVCGDLLCQCKKLARRSDPPESKAAAEHVVVSLKKHQMLVWLALIEMTNDNGMEVFEGEDKQRITIELGDVAYTAREIANYAKYVIGSDATCETLRKRVPELSRDLLSNIFEKTISQTCRVTGMNAAGFRVNPNVNAQVETKQTKPK